jgi:hypothetical protein
VKEPIRIACEAHSDLNIFAAVIAILEGGTIYTSSGYSAASKIVKLCKAETQKQLRQYDLAVAQVKQKGAK